MANGALHSLFAVKETTYGVTPTNPALETVRITGTTLALSKESLQSAEIRSDRQIADFRMGANQVGGEIQAELSCKSFDLMLQAALLSANWAAVSGQSTLEEIKAGVTRQSFTFVRNFADLDAGSKPYLVYTGCEIAGFQLTVAANAIATTSFTLFGSGAPAPVANLSGMGTPTYPAPATTAPLDSFTGTVKEGGTAIAVITEISLNLQNNIESRFVVGKKDSIRPSLGRSNLTGQVTAYFDNSTLLEKFINEATSSIEFELPDGANNKLVFKIPRVKYTGAPPDVSGEGPIMLSMPFQATLDPTSGTNLIIQRNKAA